MVRTSGTYYFTLCYLMLIEQSPATLRAGFGKFSPSQAPNLRSTISDSSSQAPHSQATPSQAPYLRPPTSDPSSQAPNQATIFGLPPNTSNLRPSISGPSSPSLFLIS